MTLMQTDFKKDKSNRLCVISLRSEPRANDHGGGSHHPGK